MSCGCGGAGLVKEYCSIFCAITTMCTRTCSSGYFTQEHTMIREQCNASSSRISKKNSGYRLGCGKGGMLGLSLLFLAVFSELVPVGEANNDIPSSLTTKQHYTSQEPEDPCKNAGEPGEG